MRVRKGIHHLQGKPHQTAACNPIQLWSGKTLREYANVLKNTGAVQRNVHWRLRDISESFPINFADQWQSVDRGISADMEILFSVASHTLMSMEVGFANASQ